MHQSVCEAWYSMLDALHTAYSVYIRQNNIVTTSVPIVQCYYPNYTVSQKMCQLFGSDFGCRPTEMTRQERVSRYVSLLLNVLLASMLLLALALEADISSIWCKDDVTYYKFDDFWDDNCL